MPVPVQRDNDLTRSRLAGWLNAAFGCQDAVVGPVQVPRTAGFSAEILLCDATFTVAGRARTEQFAVRVAPGGHRIFPDLRWGTQIAVQTALAGTDVPVAPVLGHDDTGRWLGRPFVAMRRIPGQVPADLPSYHREGWLAALAPQRREALWFDAIEILHRIHRLNPARVPQASPAPTGRLRFYADHLDYFGAARNAVAIRALDWLRRWPPRPSAVPSLLWGDARLGNMLFDDARPVAVLDWEMTDVGDPASDLAWFLHMDRHLSEGVGVPRLPGLPDRGRTVERYEQLTGRPVRDLEYHEIFAAFRFCVITGRVVRLLEQSGIVPAGSDFPLHRNATELLRRRLQEAGAMSSSSRVRRL